MLGFVQNWFAPSGTPIGVDFGTDCVRLAQVEPAEGEFKLVAAASAYVPNNVRNDVAARVNFFVEVLRELLAQGGFQGRRAILSLPASLMYIQHLRLPQMDDESLKKALQWELRGKMPIDPSHALLRHVVAGQVYQDQEPKNEIIAMAARRDLIDQLLAAASKAKLDIAGMNVEPRAIIDCFSHVYRRKSDAEATTCYLDMGANASRAVIARGTEILFARIIPIGGEHFSRAVSAALKMPLEDVKLLRNKLAAENAEEPRDKASAPAEPAEAAEPTPPAGERRAQEGFALLNAALSAAEKKENPTPAAPSAVPAGPADQRQQVEQAYREPLTKLVEELTLCRRYYEATFPNKPLDRLIFIGGEARHRGLCQSIARELGIAAQVGDPMARMSRTSDVGIESGIDRRLPQPAWAVAIGLSMGPITAAQPAAAK